jgi:hypothetical protein
MDSKDMNAISSGFLRQHFTEANEGGLTHDIGGECGYSVHAGDTRHIYNAPLWRVRIPGNAAWAFDRGGR